jgi:alpha-amylase/alpha-mannosidase (GH57 family)
MARCKAGKNSIGRTPLATGGKPISLFFRDHQLSDLDRLCLLPHGPPRGGGGPAPAHQGGGAQHWPAAGRGIGDPGRRERLGVLPRQRREFLKAFTERIAADPELRAVTASEALKVTEKGALPHIVPGSWINANYDVWIGADEDNRAWDLLSEARDFYAQNANNPKVTPENRRLAQQELWVAEGSDWCWWYGPEHSTANDEEFDLLYRKHLSNIYRLLGGLAHG